MNNEPKVTSILERQNEIRTQIESLRQQRRETRLKIENIKEQMQNRKIQAKETKQKTIEEIQQVENLKEPLSEIKFKYLEAQQELQRVLQIKKEAETRKDIVKQSIERHRNDFFHASQAFRTKLPLLKEKAKDLGLDVAHIQALLLSAECNENIDYQEELAPFDRDPSLWTTDDYEIKRKVDIYKESKAAHDAVEKDLQKELAIKAKIDGREDASLENKAKLQAQLDRIEKDNLDLEQQIQDFKSLAKAAAKPNDPAPANNAIRNPYLSRKDIRKIVMPPELQLPNVIYDEDSDDDWIMEPAPGIGRPSKKP